MNDTPHLLPVNISTDDRGHLSYAINFSPAVAGIKRFYIVENFSTDTVRAFHGHLKEAKYVLPLSGSAMLTVVPFAEGKLAADTDVVRYILSARNLCMLHIPPGFVNGFRSLEPDTRLMFFSTATVEESREDDYRFDWDFFGKEIWEVQNR